MITNAVSDTTRNHAVAIVQRAYADGRINEPELEHRLSLILEASSLPQIRLAIQDLPAPAPAPVVSNATARPAKQSMDTASLIHFSGLFSGPLGPGVAWFVTQGNPVLNRESAKALNFQLLAVIGFLATGIIDWLGFGLPRFLWFVTWLVLTIVSVVKTSRGEDWENPLTTITGFRPIGGSCRTAP